MDTTQIVLLAVIIVLTIFLVVLGFQVFFVRLFNDANELVTEVKKPIEKAGNFFTALTAGAGLVQLLKKGKKNERSTQK